jgi:hypothetical protein
MVEDTGLTMLGVAGKWLLSYPLQRTNDWVATDRLLKSFVSLFHLRHCTYSGVIYEPVPN